jgi:hypothetical protein
MLAKLPTVTSHYICICMHITSLHSFLHGIRRLWTKQCKCHSRMQLNVTDATALIVFYFIKKKSNTAVVGGFSVYRSLHSNVMFMGPIRDDRGVYVLLEAAYTIDTYTMHV